MPLITKLLQIPCVPYGMGVETGEGGGAMYCIDLGTVIP